MIDSSLFIHSCAGFLALKKPVEIRMTTGNFKARKNVAAYYIPFERKGKLLKHVVFLNLTECHESGYSLADVIAHEICHAAQWEHGIFDENFHHDAKFVALCKIMRASCKKAGFPLGKIYNPATDND